MTPGFTPAQQRAIGSYLRRLADAMGLRDWLLYVSHEPPAVAAAEAMVRVVYGRKIATIWLSREFGEMPRGRIRHILVHELTHVILDPVTSVIQNTGQELLGKPAYIALWEAVRERSELATDQVADVVAPTMPLIDWTLVDEDLDRVEWTAKPAEMIDTPPGEPDPDLVS